MTKPPGAIRNALSAPALPLLALCFALGAALKTGDVIAALGTETPSAENIAPLPAETSPAPADAPEQDHRVPLGADAASSAASPTPSPISASAETPSHQPASPSANDQGEICVSEELMSAIKERAQALKQQEAKLAGKARALEVVEKRVAEEIARLDQNRQSLQRILAEARNESNEDITRLIQIYANMKPKQAAVIFDEMAPEIAAGFIRRMRGNAASFILANMDSKKAYAITLMIAGAEAPFQNE